MSSRGRGDRSRTVDGSPRPEVMPPSRRKHYIPAWLACEQRRNQHAITDHKGIIYRSQLLLHWIIQRQGTKRRRSVAGVAIKGGKEIWHELHAPADNLAASRFQLLPIFGKPIGIVQLRIPLLPRRILDVPGIHHCQWGKDHALQTAY